MNADQKETEIANDEINEESAQNFKISQRNILSQMETEDSETCHLENSSSSTSSSASSSDNEDDNPTVPNAKYLRENLKILRSTLAATSAATEIKNLHLESQTELELNQLAMVNIVDWIQQRLNGEDPSTTPLKALLDRIRETMLVFHQAKEGGRRPKTVKTIEALFKHVYEL